MNALNAAGLNLCEDVASETGSNKFGAFGTLSYVFNGTSQVDSSGKQSCDGNGGLEVNSYHAPAAASAALNESSNTSSSQDVAGWQYDNVEILLNQDTPGPIAARVGNVLDHLPGVVHSFGSTAQ